MSKSEATRIASILEATLSSETINEIGRATGQSQRLRTVTPHRLFLVVVGALASHGVESLADLLRAFNRQVGVTVAYKAFYNRLARVGFAEFMRTMFCRLLGELAVKTLRPLRRGPLAMFDDIVIQDGSSFAVKKALQDIFPGRFTTADPAAIEIHATYSGFEDNVVSVTVAPDCEAERQFLPRPEELRNKLLLADRGYPALPYFTALTANRASFIVRLSRSFDPWVTAAVAGAQLYSLPRPIRLSHFLSQHQSYTLDLDVEFRRGKEVHRGRIVVVPGKEKDMTRWCTNLDREQFPVDVVTRLYRFRWQIELCFKEWKSYANLHAFDTANAAIVEGLIWASLCAAALKRFLAHAAQSASDGVAMSTRRVAMCTRHVLDGIVASLLHQPTALATVVRDGICYLLANARRANPRRDRESGRLQTGLALAVGELR